MSSIDHLHSETKMLQVEDHLNILSAQYLVQCQDTVNICHHITKMDLPPREMKETIVTRHYQTVLPLLANNRKDPLQALHTSFVNTAISNMKDNRVLNNLPPSINDEETLLSRRKRTTLSQLRSGHCKLLNSYKNWPAKVRNVPQQRTNAWTKPFVPSMQEFLVATSANRTKRSFSGPSGNQFQPVSKLRTQHQQNEEEQMDDVLETIHIAPTGATS